VLVSAGYDAHWRDRLADLRVSVAGFGRAVTALLASAAELCAGRMALTLEGGYDLPALSHGVAATFAALLGRPYRDPLGPSPRPGHDAVEQIAAVAALHGLR
ncbi:MAG: histone deacetylase, partial [Chloroflexi bacterium]|nr:histone deacetylase [Chloroflexota bacterium]